MLILLSISSIAQDSLIFKNQGVMLKSSSGTFFSESFNYSITAINSNKKVKIFMGNIPIYDDYLIKLKIAGATTDILKVAALSESKKMSYFTVVNDSYIEQEITTATTISAGMYKEICISPKAPGGTYNIQIDRQTPSLNNVVVRTYKSQTGVITNTFIITPTGGSTILISTK